MRRCDCRVVCTAEHHRNDVVLDGVEELLRDVVGADGVLKGEVEVVGGFSPPPASAAVQSAAF